MPVFYLDTSAFVKRYRTEAGTEVIGTLFESLGDTDRLATSIFGVLEFIATGRRLLKGKEIDEQDLEDIVAHFVRDIEDYFILHPVDDEILAHAVDVVMDHALNTADSVHLAASIGIQQFLVQSDEELVFIADDEELCEAARAAELIVINPREEDAADRLLAFLGRTDEANTSSDGAESDDSDDD